MGKTVDSSEVLYRMGKYAEVYENSDKHDLFQHFMSLLDKTIQALPNVARKNSDRVDQEVLSSEYKIVEVLHSKTGQRRMDGCHPLRIGRTLNIKNIEIGRGATFIYVRDPDGNDMIDPWVYTSDVIDFYVSDNRNDIVIQTMNSIYKLERVDE